MNLLGCFGKLAVVVVLLITPVAFALADDMPLPNGWRMPSKLELGDDWRQKDAEKFSVAIGDFNGDGVLDRAILLVSRNGKRAGLYVFLSGNGGFKAYALDVKNSAEVLPVMGIAKVTPGKYKTACGKGYWTCKKNEPSELLVQHDAVEYFKAESTSSYFYWNGQAKSFKRVWISD